MYLIRTEEVTKQFAGHRALEKVSLQVPEGSVYGLLGPNGAGKTTLIRIINRITAPDEGRILFDNRPIIQDDIYSIGYLPEERGLYKKMKVGEQAMYLAQLKGLSRAEANRRLKDWFDRFEILDWWNRKVEELSKGMQQKVQFIVTVLHRPRLLIFDEPFSGFDPINANLLKEHILELKREGSTIIFSTHNMASVEELCDNIALINKSKKILEGNMMEIKKGFRTNTYEISYTGNGSIEQNLPKGCRVVSTGKTEENTTVRVTMEGEGRPNELLKSLMEHVEIHGFREILPSMNDIFIATVNADKK
jgi:ABC-2 type transport system ATP-binding protein